MSEFAFPPVLYDESWGEFREHLARAARKTHFLAVSDDAVNGAALLVVAGKLAALALSIPMRPIQSAPTALVDGSTLIAVQILKHSPRIDGAAGDR